MAGLRCGLGPVLAVSLPQALAAAIVLAAAPSAHASGGVLELNQACAATGCFPGDSAGFPITITSPGSYRLTGNLSVATTVSAIVINGARVRLDLGGFEVAGPGSCTGSGASISCAGGGTADGIAAFFEGARVSNGSVRGFGGAGVALNQGQAESLHVEQNGQFGFAGKNAFDVVAVRNGASGISVAEGVARSCVATQNRDFGIQGFASRIVDSVASSNGRAGITVNAGSVVSDNASRLNTLQGIFASGGVVRNNAVANNGADGIVGNDGALIVGNTSANNSAAGIAALNAGSVLDNVVRGNSGVGIYLFPELGGPAAAYRGNVVIPGPVSSTVLNGVNMGGNSCNGATTCP